MSRMMRRSTRREVFSSFGRFLSIFAIIAIGVAFFSGLKVTRSTMLAAGNRYVTEQNMFDIKIISPVGATKEEVERFLDVEGVLFAQGAFTEDALCSFDGGGESVYRFHSICSDINKLKYIAGRAPQQIGECVLDGRYYGEEYIGKELKITASNSDETRKNFSCESFTVVGIATSPYYLNYERGTTELGGGSVGAFVYTLEESFFSEDGLYDEVFIDCDINGEMYSDEYNDGLSIFVDRISAACEDVFKERTSDEMAKLEEELLIKRADVEKAEQELIVKKKTTEEQLAEVFAEISEIKSSYDQTKKTFDENYDTLIATKNKLEIAIDALEKQLTVAPEAEKVEISYNLLKYKYQLDDVEASLAPLISFKESAEEQLKLINSRYSEYEKAKTTFEEEISNAQKEIDNSKKEIDSALEYARGTIDWKQLAQTRLYNTGYACFESDTGIVDAIGKIFPVFFFAVAVLVCMTTMTRMVEEQRTIIGTFKALGLKNSEIRGKYVKYSGTASLLGCVGGFFLGTKFMPYLLWEIYTMMYDFKADVTYVFDPVLLGVSLAASLICSIGVTLYCLKRSFAAVPAELMRPQAPGNGGKIMLENVGFIWNRLTFLKKVTARNIFRYKKRMFMMILGIGGCTALLLTGFGMYDSICNIVDYQYGDVTVYDINAILRENYTDDDMFKKNFSDGYDDIEEYLPIYQAAVDLKGKEKLKSATMIAPMGDSVDGFIKLALDGVPVEFPKNSEVVLNTGLAESLGVGIGDDVTITDSDHNVYNFKVSGIFDNYVSNYVIISEETFTLAGGKVGYNSVLINHKEGVDPLALGAKLASSESAVSVTVNEQVRERISAMLKNMIYVILIVVVSAGALAFVVLCNLTNINITERVREIATLRVLGYHKKECCRYIFRENNILTFVGSLVGIPLGIALHHYCMDQVKVDMIRFDSQIDPLSFVLSVVLTMLFAFFVEMFMRRKITAIEMATSLKSIE